MNTFEGWDNNSSAPGAPKQSPSYPNPYGQPERKSGLGGCLIGCLAAVIVIFLFIAGLTYWAYSWTRDNILEDTPIAMQKLDITDDEITQLKETLGKFQSSGEEEVEIILNEKQASYLIMALIWMGEKHPNEKDFIYPSAAEVNEAVSKADVKFPAEDKLQFIATIPIIKDKSYLNFGGDVEFKIENESMTIKFDKMKFGKWELTGEQAKTGGEAFYQQFQNDPNAKQAIRQVPELKIEQGIVRFKIKKLPAEKAQ